MANPFLEDDRGYSEGSDGEAPYLGVFVRDPAQIARGMARPGAPYVHRTVPFMRPAPAGNPLLGMARVGQGRAPVQFW
jgi:hypothetical protein